MDLRARAYNDETPTAFRSEKVGQIRRQAGHGQKEVVADARDEAGLRPPVATPVFSACANSADCLAPALVSYRALEPVARHHLAAHLDQRVVLALAIERHLLRCRVRESNDRVQPSLDHRQTTLTTAEMGSWSDASSAGSSRRICS